MKIVEMVAVVVLGLAVGGGAGYAVGARLRESAAWQHWAANAVALALGTALNAVGLIGGIAWLWVAAVAFIASSLAGLKYGRGVVAGPRSMRPSPDPRPGPPSLWDD